MVAAEDEVVAAVEEVILDVDPLCQWDSFCCNCYQVVVAAAAERRSLSNHIVIQVGSSFVMNIILLYIFCTGVFIARSKDDDMLLTKNMVVGESVYGEKRISVDVWESCWRTSADTILFF